LPTKPRDGDRARPLRGPRIAVARPPYATIAPGAIDPPRFPMIVSTSTTSEKETLSEVVSRAAMDAVRQAILNRENWVKRQHLGANG
jgi:hypothetical protein